jgi:hypothetical protein
MKTAILILLASVAAFAQTGRTVDLSWGLSPTLGVTGSNVYRLSAACPSTVTLAAFTKLNATPIPIATRTYSDTVPIGTYCYVVTATGAGLESAPSNTASAVATPAPPPGLTVNIAIAVTVNINGVEAAKETTTTTTGQGQ